MAAPPIQFQSIIDALSEGIVVADSTGRIIYHNARALGILSSLAQMSANTRLWQILPLSKNKIDQILQTRTSLSGLQVALSGKSLLVSLTPLEINESEENLLCSIQEMSAIEPTAKRSSSYQSLNRQLEAIFNASSDGIWVCDGKGVVIRINKASEQLNGITARQVIGKSISELLASQAFDQSVTSSVLQSGQRETVMQKVVRTGRHLLVTGTPAFDDSGNIALIVVNERDLTELNNLQQKFEKTKREKEKIEEELTELSLRELKRNIIVADSPKMRQLLQMSLKLSHLGASNILVLGESGTGKSLLAKLIHQNSKRKNKPFIEINCAALPENLLEAELFGYERGAFTGAHEKGKIGLFELAHGGTLFLDEIGDMPLTLQAKLLKYLDNNEIRRVGGTVSIATSCTTIAATNVNLKKQVEKKLFREDLFYRLSSFVLTIPPLRERTDDIAGLVRLYLTEFNSKYTSRKTISPEGIRRLENYIFPGNIRELRSIIENGVVMTDDSCLDEFIFNSIEEENVSKSSHFVPSASVTHNLNLTKNLETLEKQLLKVARAQCATTREMAAILGISQPSVVRKLSKYKITS